MLLYDVITNCKKGKIVYVTLNGHVLRNKTSFLKSVLIFYNQMDYFFVEITSDFLKQQSLICYSAPKTANMFYLIFGCDIAQKHS